MPVFSKKYLPYLVLVMFSMPLFFMNIHDGHGLGDDFAQYIKEAMNIAHGKPFYQSNYIYNRYNTTYAPAQYPPGFPLLLAPVVKIWGLSFRAMYYYNSFIAACLLFALFAYFRKYASTVASICLALLITYNQYMLDLKANVLSDVSCLLFVTLYLLCRNTRTFPWQRIAMLIMLAVMATLIRTQAILLLAAEGIWLLVSLVKLNVKNRSFSLKPLYTSPSLYIIGGSLLLIALLDKVVFYSPISTDSFYGQFIHTTLQMPLREIAEQQSGFLLTNLSGFFHYDERYDFSKSCMSFIESAALVFVVIGFITSITKRLVVDDIFFILMCLLIVYLPVHDERYFLNALPLLFFYFYTSLKLIIPAITSVDRRVIAVLLTLFYMRLGYYSLKKATEPSPIKYFPQKEDETALHYISSHVGDGDIIVFVKPRLLTLFTNKRAMNVAWQISPQMDKKIFDSMGIKYVLVMDGVDDGYYHDYLNQVQHPIDSVRISAGFMLYTVR